MSRNAGFLGVILLFVAFSTAAVSQETPTTPSSTAASPSILSATTSDRLRSTQCRKTAEQFGGPVIQRYRKDEISLYDEKGKVVRSQSAAHLPIPCSAEALVLGISGSSEFIEIIFDKKIVRLSLQDVSLYPKYWANQDQDILSAGLINGLLSGRTNGAMTGVASSRDAPFLPWPPPKATWTGDISAQIKVKGTIGDVDSQIRRRLIDRGYDTLHYFSVPGGFAITTPAERFLDDGKSGSNRWVTDRVGGWEGFTNYLQKLVNGEQTQFRVFVLVVTSDDFSVAGFKARQDDIERWNTFGRPSLSRELSNMRVDPNSRVWLMVHEFRASKSKGERLVASKASSTSFPLHRRALGFQ